MVSSGLRTIDQSLEDAALNLGSSPLETFWRVLMPCMVPSITTGALLAFLAAFADFGTPMIIGERYRMLATQIYTQFTSEFGGDHAMASSLASILLLITISALLIQRMIARKHSFGGQTIRPLSVRKVAGMRRALLSMVVWIPVGPAMIPMITILISSFLATDVGGLRLLPEFSLSSYQTVMTTRVARVAIRNSLLFTGVATLIGVVAGALMAYVIVRRPSRATRFLDTMTMIPYSVAGVVLGISLAMTFGPPPLMLAGTTTIIIMAYFIRRLPFSVRSVVSMLQQTGTEIEEASINLGVPPGRTFVRVTAPAVASGILSGALLTWATTIRELNATMILYVGRTTTIPVQVFVEVLQGQFGRASALGTVLILLTFIPIVILFKYLGKDEEFLV